MADEQATPQAATPATPAPTPAAPATMGGGMPQLPAPTPPVVYSDAQAQQVQAAMQPPPGTLATPASNMPVQAPPNPQTGAQPVPIAPGTPHAGLLNMIQSLAVGVDSFAKAAATQGREGGVTEVQDYFAKQQQQKIQAQQAVQQQTESDLRNKTMNANLQMQQMQIEAARLRLPIELKSAQLALQNANIDAFTKVKDTATALGYDVNDPAQAQEAKMRMGIGDAAQQPGALKVPFAAGSDTGTVMKAVTAALPAGKNLADYTILPQYTDGAHGTGGQILLVPSSSQFMTMNATPNQIAASNAETQGMLAQAKALGLADNPQFKALQGQYDTIGTTIKNGGVPSTADLFTMHHSIMGPLNTMIANASDVNKELQQVATTKDAAIKASQAAAAQAAYVRSGSKLPFAVWQTSLNKEIEQSITQGNPADAGKLLANGTLTLSDLKARGLTPRFMLAAINSAQGQAPPPTTSIPNPDVRKVLQQPYSATDENQGEKIYSQPSRQVFIGSARSLVQDNGVLDQLQKAHQALGTQQFPKLNSFTNLVSYQAGSPAQAAYKTALLAAVDDYAKVMGGGSPTDSSRAQAEQVFLPALNSGQTDASVTQARSGVRSQVKGAIGTNRYLMQRWGDVLGQVGEAEAKPTNATFKVPGSDGAWYWSDSQNHILGKAQ